ncbi:hypothetical protein SRABI83_00935 [Arthrobacter sp. Bi83]|nr:hypothetical protein SRABI83_00935 [Arthrobacter sp. Bi83]
MMFHSVGGKQAGTDAQGAVASYGVPPQSTARPPANSPEALNAFYKCYFLTAMKTLSAIMPGLTARTPLLAVAVGT